MALETGLSIKAGIILIQEPFIGNQEISHSGFNFYWPQDKRKNVKVMTVVRKTLVDKIVVNHKINLINYFYFILLEIQEIDSQSKKLGKKTRVVNAYDNRIGRDYTWDGGISCTKRALEDINWNPFIQS